MKRFILLTTCSLAMAGLLVNCQSNVDMDKLPDGWTAVETPEELDIVLAKHSIVLVDFSAPWCSWCQKLRPVLEELSKDYEGQIHFVEVNKDKAKALAQQYGVGGIPDIRFFIDGKPANPKGFLGYLPEDKIRPLLESLLKAKAK